MKTELIKHIKVACSGNGWVDLTNNKSCGKIVSYVNSHRLFVINEQSIRADVRKRFWYNIFA
jgi:hypothetical protein